MKKVVPKGLDAFLPQEIGLPQQLQLKGGEDKPIIITDVING